MNINPNKNLLLLLISTGILVVIIFIGLTYLTLTPTNIIKHSAIPTPSDIPVIEKSEEPEPEHLSEAVELIDITPYKGSNFTLVFDENEGIFYVYFNPEKKSEGNIEFDEFIKQHGIPNRESFFALEESIIPLPTIQP